MTRRQLYGAALVTLLLGTATARAVNWPSASGTTAVGVVLEDGAGAKLGVAANPLSTTGGGTTSAPSYINVNPSNAAAAGITPAVSPSAESNRAFCSAACNVWSLYVTTGAAAGFLMTFNATSAPADGAVTPVECVQVAASSSVALSFASGPPDRYATGMTAVYSTTGCFNKTASATAFFKARVSQ